MIKIAWIISVLTLLINLIIFCWIKVLIKIKKNVMNKKKISQSYHNGLLSLNGKKRCKHISKHLFCVPRKKQKVKQVWNTWNTCKCWRFLVAVELFWYHSNLIMLGTTHLIRLQSFTSLVQFISKDAAEPLRALHSTFQEPKLRFEVQSSSAWEELRETVCSPNTISSSQQEHSDTCFH